MFKPCQVKIIGMHMSFFTLFLFLTWILCFSGTPLGSMAIPQIIEEACHEAEIYHNAGIVSISKNTRTPYFIHPQG